MSVANSFLLDRYLEELRHDTGNSAKASTDEVLLLREQLRTLSLEMLTLKHSINKGVSLPTVHCNGFTHIVQAPMQDANDFYTYRDHRYSSSTHSPSCCSGCSYSPPSSGIASTSDPYTDLHDLVHMSGPLTEESVLRVLKHRWHAGECYTRVGPVLVSLNPYRGVPIEQALHHSQTNQSRNIQRLVSHVHKQLIDTGSSQTIVLGGESGSGKTYTSHLLLNELYKLAGGGIETDSFMTLAASLTVLRSLGCAKTAANSESSRMGHYIEVLLADCSIYRTKIHCYWLDHARVVQPRTNESNYHIFYQMLAGLTQDERVKLHLGNYSTSTLAYLNKVRTDSTGRDRLQFESWKNCLQMLGIPFLDVMRILASVLLLGNIQFVEDGGYELDIKGNNEITAVAALLGISGVSLYRGLTTRTHSLKGQVFKSLCDAKTANLIRDTLAKALYCRTVLTIVKRLNSLKKHNHSAGCADDARLKDLHFKSSGRSSSPVPSKSSTNHSTSSHSSTVGEGFIGIVDMFGFEITQCNRLEQLCINLCNEKLQRFYNETIFGCIQETCSDEGVHCDVQVEYQDNSLCMQLLTTKCSGIFSLLAKQCSNPNADCQNLMDDLMKEHHNNSLFQKDPDNSNLFTVTHCPGNITYNAGDFINGNRDVITDDVISIFQKHSCNFGFAGYLFAPELKTLQGSSPKGFVFRISPSPPAENTTKCDQMTTSLSQDLEVRLNSLMKTLSQASPHFVRLIKSNETQEPNSFDSDAVRRQLKHLQLLETVQLMSGGYPHQISFVNFVRRYRFLARCKALKGVMEKAHTDSQVILDCFLQAIDQSKLPYISTRWSLGTRHVFLSEEAWQCLEHLRDSRQNQAAILIQSLVRRWIHRRNWMMVKAQLQTQRASRTQKSTVAAEPIYEGIQSPTLLASGKTPTEERCNTGIVEQTCNVYGLDMNHPPPVPKSRPYTVTGGMKVDFPQTRIMKCNYPDNCKEPLLGAGEPVLVTGVSTTKGLLIVEHNSCILHIPYQLTQVKTNGLTIGTKI